MSEYFGDPMTPLRQRVYWDCCTESHVTLDEWAFACSRAMAEATFTRIPLFAVLRSYVEEIRKSTASFRLLPPASTLEIQKAQERKHIHLEYKRLAGTRYRPPCHHGAQGNTHWPNSPCDPDLCDTPFFEETA